MHNLKIKMFLFVVFFFCFPFTSSGKVITEDTVWSGAVTLEDDILVPEGRTLIILPGTTINMEPSDRTKTDPEYLSSLTEITVRGRLNIEGKTGSSVLFQTKGEERADKWAGIIIDGGTASINR